MFICIFTRSLEGLEGLLWQIYYVFALYYGAFQVLTIFDLLAVIVPVLMSLSLPFCCRKKKKATDHFPAAFMQGYDSKESKEPGEARSKDSQGGMGGGAGGFGGGGVVGGQQIRAPEPGDAKKMAGTFDPNYQTLANLNDDIFKKKEGEFGGAAAGGGGGGGGAGGGFGAPVVPGNFRPPEEANKKAGTFDPNYQTLAGLNEDVFKKKDPGGGGGGGFGGGGGLGGGGGGVGGGEGGTQQDFY